MLTLYLESREPIERQLVLLLHLKERDMPSTQSRPSKQMAAEDVRRRKKKLFVTYKLELDGHDTEIDNLYQRPYHKVCFQGR